METEPLRFRLEKRDTVGQYVAYLAGKGSPVTDWDYAGKGLTPARYFLSADEATRTLRAKFPGCRVTRP